MNIGDILKAAGGMALDVFAPGSRQVINAFLPEDKKLLATATGADANTAVDSLPADQKASLLEKQVDLEIAREEGWTSRYVAMVGGEQQPSRAWIAKVMAIIVFFECLGFTVWAFVYPDQMTSPGLWTAFATLTGIPASVLAKYFGELRKEQRNRQEAMGAPPAVSILASLLKK